MTRKCTYLAHIGALASFQLCPVVALASPPETLEELRVMSDAELERLDVIRMNLIVAKEVDPDIDIRFFEKYFDALAAYAKYQIDTLEPAFDADTSPYKSSKEIWKCAVLWEIVTEDFGIGYLQEGISGLDHTQPWQKFVHGVVTRKQGTCCNLPVIYLALGQRLGFPIRAAMAPRHTYLQWVYADGSHVNFDVTSRKGMMVDSDANIREADINTCPDFYQEHVFRAMSARELLGSFLRNLGDVYAARKYLRHAVVAYSNALFCYPDNPVLKTMVVAALHDQGVDRTYLDDPQRREPPQFPTWSSRDGRTREVISFNWDKESFIPYVERYEKQPKPESKQLKLAEPPSDAMKLDGFREVNDLSLRSQEIE